MTVLAAIEEHIRADESMTITSVGGMASLLAEADAIVVAPYLDILVRLADAAVGDEITPMDQLVLRGFREGRQPIEFREAAGLLVENGRLRGRLAAPLARVLTNRLDDRAAEARGLLEAYALEALFRLALAGAITPHRPLAVLAEVSANGDGLFAQHAAKLAGAAFDIWRDPELLEALERLRQHPGVEAEAAFELGLATLSRALDAPTTDEIAALLETARVYLRQACEAGEGRPDAIAYVAVIDIIEQFARGAPPEELEASLDALRSAVADRAHLLYGAALPVWLRPRADREAQWTVLLHTAQSVARALERPSWLDAGAVMGQLIAVYDADRTIRAGAGLETMLRPRVECGLARQAGLLAHLDDLLRDDEAWTAEYGLLAHELRARVADRAEERSTPRKFREDAQYPLLSRVLPIDVTEAAFPAGFLERLEQGLSDHARAFNDVANPVVQRLLCAAQQAFTGCSDYTDDTRRDFDALILQVVLFCKDRQDAGHAAWCARRVPTSAQRERSRPTGRLTRMAGRQLPSRGCPSGSRRGRSWTCRPVHRPRWAAVHYRVEAPLWLRDSRCSTTLLGAGGSIPGHERPARHAWNSRARRSGRARRRTRGVCMDRVLRACRNEIGSTHPRL